jgi:hypothetical protein
MLYPSSNVNLVNMTYWKVCMSIFIPLLLIFEKRTQTFKRLELPKTLIDHKQVKSKVNRPIKNKLCLTS